MLLAPEEILREYFGLVKKIKYIEMDAQQLENEIADFTFKLEEERHWGFEIVANRRLVAAAGGIRHKMPKGLDEAYVVWEAQVSRLEKELLKKRTVLLEKEQQIRELREQAEPTRRIICELEHDEQKILEMTYLDGVSNRHIALELNYSEKTIRRKKEQIIQKIIDKCRKKAAEAPQKRRTNR
jgi:DNA-directed RNA polymerase specialized sigma24 family protein